MLAAWLKARANAVWWAVFVGTALPALYLGQAYWSASLGPNPLESLLHITGRSALVLLAFTLLITPLRRILTALSRLTQRRYGKRVSDWNWLVRMRRLLGLACFAYALGHAWIYLDFDLGYAWSRAFADLVEKPYLGLGAAALALLVPLAATSTQSMMRSLGRNWRRLHMLTYAVAVFGLLHFWWLAKPGNWSALPDTLVIGALLGYRLLAVTGMLERWEGDGGQEVPERAAAGAGGIITRRPPDVGPASSPLKTWGREVWRLRGP